VIDLWRTPTSARSEPLYDPYQSEHALLSARADDLEELLRTLADGTCDRSEAIEAKLMLGVFRRRLLGHLASEERDEVVERVVAAAPRFAELIDRLRLQHVGLRERMGAVASGAPDGVQEGGWARVYSEFRSFRRALRDHERNEHGVMQRAYLEDLGGGD